MKNIYLVGFMGTGKTAVGKILSEKLSKKFVEMDELIEKNENKKITEIFASCGEPYFRKLERDCLKELSTQQDLIVSCGGGLICNEESLKVLRETGIIVNLIASAKVIYDRTKKYTHRPLLNVDDPLKKIEELLIKRAPFYKQAHYSIDSDQLSAEEIAEKIVGIVK
jgi:shikimate kinase